jgi:hypothetical protein
MEVIVRSLEETNGWGIEAIFYGLQIFQERSWVKGGHRCRVLGDGQEIQFFQFDGDARKATIKVQTLTERRIVEVLCHIGVLEVDEDKRFVD